MTQPPWTPDFSRAPQSAHELWQRVVSSKSIAAVLALDLSPAEDEALAGQLGAHTTAGKCAAIVAAAALDDGQDDVLAVLLPDFIVAARALHAAVGTPAKG